MKLIHFSTKCKNRILLKLYIMILISSQTNFLLHFCFCLGNFEGAPWIFLAVFNKDLQMKCRKVVKITLSSISSVRSIAKDILQKPSDFCAFLQKYAKRIIYFAPSALILQEEIMLISWFPFEGFIISWKFTQIKPRPILKRLNK